MSNKTPDWLFGWPGFNWAPQNLVQPINPGWSFTVNNTNSTAPQVEQDVLARHSYGRQIGRVMDAVCALADALPKTESDPRIQAFRTLARDVDQIKQRGSAQRMERLREELEELKRTDPKAWKRLADLWR
jgi:hypothetical protein